MAPATHRLKGFSITGLVTGIVGLGLSTFWTIALFAGAADDHDNYAECVADADTITELEICNDLY
jgi:hypothetical protein